MINLSTITVTIEGSVDQKDHSVLQVVSDLPQGVDHNFSVSGSVAEIRLFEIEIKCNSPEQVRGCLEALRKAGVGA